MLVGNFEKKTERYFTDTFIYFLIAIKMIDGFHCHTIKINRKLSRGKG